MKRIQNALQLEVEILDSQNTYDVIQQQSDDLAKLAFAMKLFVAGDDKEGKGVKEAAGDAYLAVMGMMLYFEIDPDELLQQLIEKHKDILQ
jgi:hypothetical protein